MGKTAVLKAWEGGEYEDWARRVLLLPGGYEWASDQILWHVGEEARSDPERGRLYVVVISRAVRPECRREGS
ncbi:hypothetical protein [Streptomyces sp. CBMA29]|uniref:hypothetical protein n=1 Tax=Streptomyces sp. CBMA29 TaxID=1896314 RepID=UPI001661EB9B|nr:hypothetical protein [Streptomyces sp. CBMA29]